MAASTNSDGNREKNCMVSLVHTKAASARETMHIICSLQLPVEGSGEEGDELFVLPIPPVIGCLGTVQSFDRGGLDRTLGSISLQ